jgi:hypothetical protein
MTALFDWLSTERAATHLSTSTSETVTRDDVLALLINNRLKASVCITSTPLLVWPMVTLTGDDAAKFQLDEQNTATYRGKSFAMPGGNLLAPHRVITGLNGGRILDLPLTKSSRDFLQRLKDNPVPVGKRLCLPRGTLLEIPGTGDYFVVANDLNTPDVFCEIVVSTAALREFQAGWTAFLGGSASEAVAAPVAVPAPVDEVLRQPLTMNQIANCFAGFHNWEVAQWKRALGSPDKWLKSCRNSNGTQGRGGSESTWWPMQIAAALIEFDRRDTQSLRARFKNQEPLKPWFDVFENNHPQS